MKYCDCNDYAEEMEHAIALQSIAKLYGSTWIPKVYQYCPFCGKLLVGKDNGIANINPRLQVKEIDRGDYLTPDEIKDIVQELNIEYIEKYPNFCDVVGTVFFYSTDGFTEVIDFLDYIRLWRNDDDNRNFNEDTHEYEPLKEYLISEASKLITPVN